MLAKHGLVVWGDTAEEAYRRTIEVINQRRVRQRAHRPRARFGGRHPAAERVSDAARELLPELLPTVRGAVSSERLAADPRHLAAVGRVRLLGAGRAPGHGGRPVPRSPGAHQAAAAVDPGRPESDDADTLRGRIAERAAAFRAGYREYVETYGDETTVPADPDPRIVLIQHLGLVATGTTTKASRISRDLYHRAIEVMAGAEALGEFVSLDAEESFAIEYWPLELYKLAQAPPGELQGQVAFVTGGAGGIGRAIGDALGAAGACVVAFDLDRAGAGDAVAAHGDGGSPSAAT